MCDPKKGGVAKTTPTVAVAQMLDVEFGKKVLVIDLDPQEVNQPGATVAQLFRDAMSGEKKFDLAAAILKRVGNVADSRRVALLPSPLTLLMCKTNSRP